MTNKSKLKFETAFKDRHGRWWHYFCFRGQKFKLPGKPGSAEYMAANARFLADAESGTLCRKDLGYLKGSIGWGIEKFLISDVGFRKLKSGTQRNYRHRLDTIKAEIGQFQFHDLTPAGVRAIRDSIK